MGTLPDQSNANYVPNTPEVWHAAAARIRAANRTAIRDALDGVPHTHETRMVLAMLASYDAGTVGVLCELFTALRVVTRRYTVRLSMRADQIERAYVDNPHPGWQILDARDEMTWHDVTGVAECEDEDCDIYGCVVVVSTAWTAGAAHLGAAEVVQVRIPAAAP